MSSEKPASNSPDNTPAEGSLTAKFVEQLPDNTPPEQSLDNRFVGEPLAAKPAEEAPGSFLRASIAVLCAAFSAVLFLSAGLFAVAVPDAATQVFSTRASAAEISPFSADDLYQAAVATKHYTFGAHDEEELYGVLALINIHVATYGSFDKADFDLDALERAYETKDIAWLKPQLLSANERYTLNLDAISHLDDVFTLMQKVWPVLGACALLACLFAFLCLRMGGAALLAKALLGAGSFLMVAFALLGIWAAIDFYGFFNAAHTLFFSEGSWMFSADSLLICMYPLEFWMGMASLWLSVSVLLSILSIASAIVILRRNKKVESNACRQ